jgi:two-component sensor histidine kinase
MSVRVEENLVERDVSGDVAVPLALFAAEALTNVFKYAFPPGQVDGVVKLDLVALDGGKLRLSIADNGVGFAETEQKSGIGSRLIKTFGQQIGGVSSLRSVPGKGTTVEVVFRDPDCADASRPTTGQPPSAMDID